MDFKYWLTLIINSININMKKYLFLIVLIVALAACDNNSSTDTKLNSQSSTSLSDTLRDTSRSTLPTITNNTTGTSNTKVNPEHGQPGHRCDIAVGAPLNSTPAPITQQTQPAPINQPQPATPKFTTATGMNPEHGKPGHRCDIGVGTPLSQPVKKIP